MVEEYDADEYELRKKHKMCELILKYEGDKELAQKDFDANVVQLFENKVTFFDILTNAVSQEDSSPTMRKLAIVLMKDWIINAYNDYIASYRNEYKPLIRIKINDWENTTSNGSNVDELTESYKEYLKYLREQNLKEIHANYIVISLLVVFLCWLCMSGGNTIALVFTICSALYMVLDIFNVNKARQALKDKFYNMFDSAVSIINSICAEYEDWKQAYERADKEAENTLEYLKQYSPTDFSKNNAENKILMFETEDY